MTAACLARAFELGAEGVWGATTDAERRRTRSGPRRAAGGRSPKRARRAGAVALVRDGTRRAAVAAQYGVSPRTVDRWLAATA